jgi:hypothetical protein
MLVRQEARTCGDNACHPERSEGAGSPDAEILRCAQDDSRRQSATGEFMPQGRVSHSPMCSD